VDFAHHPEDAVWAFTLYAKTSVAKAESLNNNQFYGSARKYLCRPRVQQQLLQAVLLRRSHDPNVGQENEPYCST